MKIQAWAILSPKGDIVGGRVSTWRKGVYLYAVATCTIFGGKVINPEWYPDHPYAGKVHPDENWPALRKKGYRCVRVTVTVKGGRRRA